MGIKQKLQVIKKLIKEPTYIPDHLNHHLNKVGMAWLLPDALLIRVLYKRLYKRPLNLKNPVRFTEKSLWLKRYDRNPKYTMMSDKYLVKDYIANTIGDEHVVPLLGVWNSFEEIDFSSLPKQFVLKTNHGLCGMGVWIIKDKDTVDMTVLKKEVQKYLKFNFYWGMLIRDWASKNVKPVVFAEKYLVEDLRDEIADYKFFCFNGKVKMIQVNLDMLHDMFLVNHYNERFERITIERTDSYENQDPIPMPNNISDMFRIAELLSKDITLVRVDLYNVNEKIYFGELTIYPAGCFFPFKNDADDLMLGSWLELPDKKLLKKKNATYGMKLNKLQ